MERAQANLRTPYQPYQDKEGKPIQRIAGFTDQQKQIQNNILNQQMPGQFSTASDLAKQAGLGAIQAGKYNPNSFNMERVQNPAEFDSQQAQQYMSPYMQNVLDVQKQQALRDAQIGQLTQNLGAARMGSYGGARQLLATTERERNLGSQMSQIQATGQQAAFENAQKQFNAQQAARMQAALANQQAGLETQRMGEQSRQFGADLGLRGYAQANQSAQTLGNLGTAQQQAQQAMYGQQQSTAAQQQALQQEIMTQQYQDFLNQRDYYNQQLQQYSSLLHGVPVTPNTTSTQSVPNPGLAQQIMGTGLGAASIYKTFAGA
jgi:hypothetical protein